MQVTPLLKTLEFLGPFEVPLHHIDEPIIIFGRASRILHQQSAGLSQGPTHLQAQPPVLRVDVIRQAGRISSWFSSDLQVRTQIDHRQVHRDLEREIF